MILYKIIVLQLLVAVAYSSDHQTYPGTSTRPILSDSEAALYTKETYLQGWTPETISTSKQDYLVGSGGYSTIQEAVNAAVTAGGTTRKYIKISAGTYREAVLIPKTDVPLTLYGTPGSPGDVHIVLTQPATMTGTAYANQVNPNGAKYKSGDPAYSMYYKCASKDTIGTTCSSVFQASNDNLELAYLTVENPSTEAQAVAFLGSGDKQQFDHVWFYGFQDTLYVKNGRKYFKKPTIKGDVDFIFGDASAVFEWAQIIARGDRRSSAVVFAPNTPKTQKYGFLTINSKITADNAVKSKKGCSLARDWLSNDDVNGQVVIRETEVVDVINVTAPYATSTGGTKPFAGNANTNRDLDDTNYNRFWEYKNTGTGA
ncbi:pectinesterase-like [Anthonomus grandis grandis]|uniref:pectinesterase-like n=1 Tax=Anthonomus grandis grandis TaxID=2921223 RepID=UPI0021653B8B|nr:pectinesterase-like [Anthonomus grandis grandis]